MEGCADRGRPDGDRIDPRTQRRRRATRGPRACTVWSSATRAASRWTDRPRAHRDRRAPRAGSRRTGVGHYTRQILRHLPAADPLPEYVAWYLHAKGLFRAVASSTASRRTSPSRRRRFPARVFGPVSSRLGAPEARVARAGLRRAAGDELRAPGHAEPGVVLVVHDLAYERFPEMAPQIDARWRRVFRRWLGTRRGRDRPVRERPARPPRHQHEVDPDRVHVIPHGVEPFDPPPPSEVAASWTRFGVDGPYALFVGGIEPRKNLTRLLEAFALARDRTPGS